MRDAVMPTVAIPEALAREVNFRLKAEATGRKEYGNARGGYGNARGSYGTARGSYGTAAGSHEAAHGTFPWLPPSGGRSSPLDLRCRASQPRHSSPCSFVAPAIRKPDATFSAAAILAKSANRLSATVTGGVELLEYELVLDGVPKEMMPDGADGTYHVRQAIDHDVRGRFRFASYGPDGRMLTSIAQDPQSRAAGHGVGGGRPAVSLRGVAAGDRRGPVAARDGAAAHGGVDRA